MKTTVADKKGQKRTHNENVKSNQAQGDINELKKNIKKTKFVDVKQNGSPVLGQKAPVVHKKKEQNKTIKQQSSSIKQSTTQGETKAKTELSAAKPKNETKGMKKRSRRSRPYSQINLTTEQLTKKIAEIQSREVVSKTAKRKLGVLLKKLKESGVNSEKLDELQKKSNKKAENRVNVLMKKANDEKKMKLEKKPVLSKGKPQEVDDDDSEEEEIDSDVEEESEEEESDENERQNVQLTVKRNEAEDESDEDEEDDEDEEEENELEIEEDEELESDEDEEEVESLEGEEDDKDDEDEEDDEDDEDDEEDEDEDETEKNTILKKLVLSGTKNKEMQNKQEQNKNKQEQNKNKQVQNKNTQEQNKNKQVPQSFDNQQKGELHKKRYVLFVGNLPLE